MAVSATITFPDGRSATITGPDKASVRERIASIRAQDEANAIEALPSLDQGEVKRGYQSGEPSSVVGALRDIGHVAGDTAKDVLAVGEVGLTMATGAVGEMLGGWRGSLNLLFGGSIDEAAASARSISDLIAIAPHTERGKELLDAIAVPMMSLERGADKVSEVASLGNPFAAALIKTFLLGGTELIAPGKRSVSIAAAKRQIVKNKTKLQSLANDLGISLDPRDIESTTIDAIRKMTPDEKAQNAILIQDSLKQAADIAKVEKNALFEQAKATRAFVKQDSVKGFATGLRKRLDDKGYDLSPSAESMTKVRKTLDELERFGDDLAPEGMKISAVNLTELEKIRRRANKRYGRDPSSNSALVEIRQSIDKFLNEQFDNAAISGDPAAIKAWQDARRANAQWHRNFSEDRVIANLISKDATPETINRWLLGASSMKAKTEAASVVKRIKEVLGNDHPAVEGIRQDFLFGVAEPLTRESPSFKQFIRNYENAIENNPSLIKELGLKHTDMENLYKIAKAQSKLPKPEIQTIDLYRATSQFLAGHQIAKAGLRVRLVTALTRLAAGADRVTKKGMIAQLSGAIYGQPAIPKESILAAEFIAGASITAIPHAEESQ